MTIQWHHIRHLVTGEAQLVASLEPYDTSEWEVTLLHREVDPAVDEFDPATRRIRVHEGRHRERERHRRIEAMSKADLVERMERLEEIIKNLEETK